MNWLQLFLAVLSGWAAGVLVNYLADVLPYHKGLIAPLCLSCEAKFPLKNYLFWPRRCEACGHKRSLRVWVVEAFGIGAAVWLWSSAGANPIGLLASSLLLIYFGVVVVIDMEHRLILHVTSLAGAAIGSVVGVWLHGWQATALGGLAGFAGMMGLFVLGPIFLMVIKRLLGKTTSEVPFGFGDVILAGILGLILGWPGILAGLFLTIVLGGIFSLVFLVGMLLLGRYKALTPIPYGPFLVISGVLLLFFRDLFV